MKLERVRLLYCIAVIAIAVILDCTGGFIGWTAAVVVLAGALPLFNIGCQAAANREKQRTLAEVTDVVAPPEHQDTHQSGTAARDHLTSEQSA